MTGKDVIKQLMEESDVTNAQLARRINVTQATLWARLNNQSAKDLPLSVFDEMVRALGYEIVIRRRKDTEVEGCETPIQFDAPSRPEMRGRPRKEDNAEGTPDRSEK